MKKILPIFVALSLCFTGCASQKETKSVDINNPHEIIINGEILSYYDEIPLDTNNAYELSTNENKIRSITIKDSSVSTYKDISVGDSITKIIESFEHEYNIGENYMVIFNNGIEEEPTNQNKEDNWLWINYITDGKNITQIQIYDVKYGFEMR